MIFPTQVHSIEQNWVDTQSMCVPVCTHTRVAPYVLIEYLYTTGYFKTISIIAHSSSAAENYRTILSGARAHGECATFELWVGAFGPELL
jgi:hypothetical protein